MKESESALIRIECNDAIDYLDRLETCLDRLGVGEYGDGYEARRLIKKIETALIDISESVRL